MTTVLERAESPLTRTLREQGEMVRAARGRHTQRETARAIRISPSLLCRVENGERRLTVSTARALDRFLETGTMFELLAADTTARR